MRVTSSAAAASGEVRAAGVRRPFRRIRPLVAVVRALEVLRRREGHRIWPSHSANSDTSGPSRSSSTSTSPPKPASERSAASTSSCVRQTKTPFPAASPSALRTQGGRASGRRAALSTSAAASTSFANAFEPSISRRPHSARRPRRRTGAARPRGRGRAEPRGRPRRGRPRASARARGGPRRPRREWDGTARAARCPGLPGAAWSSSRSGDCASFQASACSRPPEPTTRTRTARVYEPTCPDRGQSNASTRSRAAPGPDERHRHAERLLDEGHVRPGARGSSSSIGASQPESTSNTGRQWWKSLWCAGKSSVSRPVGKAVADADGKLGERREDVELRQRERRDPVDADGEAQRDEIEPAAAPLAARHRPELLPELLDLRLLGGRRSRSGTGPRRRG